MKLFFFGITVVSFIRPTTPSSPGTDGVAHGADISTQRYI